MYQWWFFYLFISVKTPYRAKQKTFFKSINKSLSILILQLIPFSTKPWNLRAKKKVSVLRFFFFLKSQLLSFVPLHTFVLTEYYISCALFVCDYINMRNLLSKSIKMQQWCSCTALAYSLKMHKHKLFRHS